MDRGIIPVLWDLSGSDRARSSLYYGDMKTTLDLPNELMRAIKIRAVEENRKLKDAIADLLRRGLSQEASAPAVVRKLVKLPLVRCAHEARLAEEMTPERVSANQQHPTRLERLGEADQARGATPPGGMPRRGMFRVLLGQDTSLDRRLAGQSWRTLS